MAEAVQQPSSFERLMNRFMNFLVSNGMSPSYMRELQVRGRKSGRVFSTPVNLIEHDGKQWLVAPRGRTQWTLNADAAGEVVLKRGGKSEPFGVRATAPEERAVLLKKYLEAFPSQVQRFFKVKAGAPVSEFASVADEYPVYELQPRASA